MTQKPKKIEMSATEIGEALQLLDAGFGATEVAARLGRHRRTIERIRETGSQIAEARRSPRTRAPMQQHTKAILRAGAFHRRAMRLPHISAERWSENWFRQQQCEFVAVMTREHPELVNVTKTMLLTADRLIDGDDSKSRPALVE